MPEPERAAAAEASWLEWAQKRLTQLQTLPQLLSPHTYYALIVAVLAIIASIGPLVLLKLLLTTILYGVGASIGLGLGLGFATHVYDVLTLWKEREQQTKRDQDNSNNTSSNNNSKHVLFRKSLMRGSLYQSATAAAVTSSSSYGLVDEQTYASLMQSAGYHFITDKSLLRGQVLRQDMSQNKQHNNNYTYHGDHPKQLLQTLFPVLPAPIQDQLAILIDFIMRDFCAIWCCLLDAGCENPYDEITGQLKPPFAAVRTQDDDEHTRDEASASYAADTSCNTDPSSQQQSQPQFPRRMLFQLNPMRKVAIMEQLYYSLTMLLGNLATRVEHVNALELLLLKAVKVLAHSFKVYRKLRRVVQQRHAGGGGKVTEMQLTKELLLQGKLHKAVTFGLDVPSLLFADANGKECGWPTEPSKDGVDSDSNTENNSSAAATDDDLLLEHRLFDSGLLEECELDYNRVLAARMTRALLSRQDFGSQLLTSVVTEILGQCVLTPMMSCFCPEYLNSWIVAGLAATEAATTGSEDESNKVDAAGESEETVAAAVTESVSGEDAAEATGEMETTTSHDDVAEAVEKTQEETAAIDPTDHISAMISETESDASETDDSVVAAAIQATNNDNVNTLLAMALIDMQQFVDFEEFRTLRAENQSVTIDWDDPGCREAILRLVLVIEQTLTNGRCIYKPAIVEDVTSDDSDIAGVDKFGDGDEEDEDENDGDELELPIETTPPEYEVTTLSQILMEMTSDIDAFEERVAKENTFAVNGPKVDENMIAEPYKPTPTEQSTLRTLIAAWLHTGQIFRVVTVLVQAHATVLAPYFAEWAFLRNTVNANGFVRQLKAIDGVEILVDTMMVLSAPRLDETNREDLNALVKKSVATSSKAATGTSSSTSILAVQQMYISSTPRYLDFHRNESFATSLRAERERRMLSWKRVVEGIDVNEGVATLCHVSASEQDVAQHKELHYIARMFYSGTNIIALRDGARNKRVTDRAIDDAAETSSADATVPVSLLTVETTAARRRIEVPDDDSSFLLRAQPRPLNAVGVHRDQRNHDQSFKSYAATYDEPAVGYPAHYSGGKYLRNCLIRYYPIDRTASVALQDGGSRRLDQRQGASGSGSSIATNRPASILSNEFLRERHLCQRWTPKGTNRTQGIMSSSTLESTDFNQMPRTGKAIDFVYRLSLFERPMVDLGGKHFTVHDSASLGTHRADASALELSDATLSAALCILGQDCASSDDVAEGKTRQAVEMGEDGYPIIWMKFSRNDAEGQVEIKPYRVSFVRAALLVTSARQEAQQQNLLACVKTGSAKQATRALTDQRLRPTATLLEYASSRLREKQSILLRDLKLGMNHIDREQLRRNGLISPRYPTVIRELTVTVEDTLESTRTQGNAIFGASDTLYKIRCQVVVDIEALSSELRGDPAFMAPDGSIAKTIREEWVVLRTYEEFNKFHKHLKAQVSFAESSGNAGTRLVGAATAAFAAGAAVAGAGGGGRTRQRVAMIPSLGQASKAALGPIKKLIQKRKEALDAYLKFLVAPRHLLNRSTDLLVFIGAIYPLPPEIVPNQLVPGVTDPLGRTEMSRKIVSSRAASMRVVESTKEVASSIAASSSKSSYSKAEAMPLNTTDDLQDDDDLMDGEDDEDGKGIKSNMIPAIESKIAKVPLVHVRRQVFELLHYLFGFENASFVRNRMLTALKTMSFAVTTGGEFKRMLYKIHCTKLSASAVAEWIGVGVTLIWPDGQFFTKAPPTPPDILREQSQQSMDLLHGSFPEQIRSVLGQELTHDGINIMHEMLQNRLMVKSIFYILMDLLWLEVFPEIGDVADGNRSLDVESKK